MATTELTSNSAPYGLDDDMREMVLETLRQLRTRLLTREKILAWDRAEVFPEAEIRELLSPDIGLQLLFIPEKYGGMGGGARDCFAVTREMSRICLGVATAFFAIQLGADPILVGATHAQKQKWLGAIAEGETLVAYAVTEPGAGSNLAALKTKAEPIADDGGTITHYKLNGAKQFISTGGYADLLTVLALTPEGPTFFVVEKGTPGFSQGKGEEKHGIRASNTSPLTLDDVVVPVENLVGGVPGQGLKQANQVFGYTRLMVGAMALGAGEAALDIAIPYAQERIQFGGPLCDKQGYTHKLIVPHKVNMLAGKAYLDEVALRIDSETRDLQVEGSIGKLFVTEAANWCADACMQALGGYGYITEFEVEKIKRDVKITCIYEGTSEIQQSIISTFRWKAARKSKGAFYGEMAAEMEALAAQQPELGAATLAQAAKAMQLAFDFATVQRLTKQQYLMFRLADMTTALEVGMALTRKAAAAASAGDGEAAVLAAAARLFSADTGQLFARDLRTLAMGTDLVPPEAGAALLEAAGAVQLGSAGSGMVSDMDTIADALFGRSSASKGRA
ncbi:MAG: acyl-CoA dehydrogenase family protein [Desulfosarcinaceae bacterium]|nr:acyl-CoA dehydrogenase family protein [Desulfosarcinaceae bacterium]